MPSGYFIGLAGLRSIADLFHLILIDEGAHYCLKDGAKLTDLPVHRFAHCDVDALGRELKRHVRAGQRPIVVTDGVFATTGRVPPLGDYAAALAPYDGRLFVDESHGFGVIGRTGRGSAEYCGVEHLVTSGATLGKALCAQGAFIGCLEEEVARLRSQPGIRGACAGSPISAAVSAASLSYVAQHPEIRHEISALTDYFRTRLRNVGIPVIDSPAPIVSFRLGDRRAMQALQLRLFQQGIYIYHSTYLGAGPEGMIRCAVFRDHSKGDIDTLVVAVKESC